MSRNPFRADIEGLRAIAVLGVMAYHFGIGNMTGGFVGVDSFFVISGYLITGILLSEIETTEHIDLAKFYGRRVRRLLPASIAVTIIALIAGFFILSPHEEATTAKAGIFSSLYISNFWFLRQVFDYFAPENATNPFLHFWTLSVEEQFYLLWPTMLLFVWKIKKLKFPTELFMVIVTLASFSLCLFMTYHREPWAFYASPARAWEFGIGGLVSLSPVAERVARWRGSVALGWAGLVALAVSFCIIDDSWSFPGLTALWPVMATAGILLAGAGSDPNGPVILLGTRPIQWIGRHSYSIYLWHWPIIVFAKVVNPAIGTEGKVICAALTFACAAASFSFIEHPIRTNRWLSSKAMRSVRLGAALSFCGVVLSFAFLAGAHLFATRSMQKVVSAQADAMSVASSAGCLIGLTASDPVACSFGDAHAKKVFVLFGDSHADEWSTPLAELAARKGWRMMTFLKSSCSAADIPVYSMRLRRLAPECEKWRTEALKAIVDLHPAAVVIGEFSSDYIQGPLAGLGEHAVGFETWRSGLARTLDIFKKRRIPVVLIRDTPTPMQDVKICLSRALWHDAPAKRCRIARSFALDDRVTKAENGLVARALVTTLIDLSDKICGPKFCPVMVGGTVVYRDTNHLTNAFASRFGQQFDAALSPLMNPPQQLAR